MGFGIINFIFAIPAFYTIDTFGRRNLLLCTFPFMAIFQLLTGLGFLLEGKAQLAMVMTGMCEYPKSKLFHHSTRLISSQIFSALPTRLVKGLSHS